MANRSRPSQDSVLFGPRDAIQRWLADPVHARYLLARAVDGSYILAGGQGEQAGETVQEPLCPLPPA